MKVLRIVDWDRHFENNRTRELKRMEWVPVPNKHDGDGFTELLDHRDGVLHYGAWHLILQVASKCDPRGTLLRDGKRAHDLASLSRITRISEKVLKSAIERLLNIGWIEIYDDPALECDNPALACASRARVPEGKGRERREGKEEGSLSFDIPENLSTPEFLKAWESWKAHRKEIKKPLTVQSVKMQMDDFQKWGAARSIAAISFTIKKGWQGIREEEKPGGFGNATTTRRPPVRDIKTEYRLNLPRVIEAIRDLKKNSLTPADFQDGVKVLFDKYRDIPGIVKEALEIVG